MHDLKTVHDIFKKDRNNWTLDGRDVATCTYVHKGDDHILTFVFDGGDDTKTFVSTFTHDIEDDDQYVGVGVCFYSTTHIEFRQWEDEANETVSHVLTKKKS